MSGLHLIGQFRTPGPFLSALCFDQIGSEVQLKSQQVDWPGAIVSAHKSMNRPVHSQCSLCAMVSPFKSSQAGLFPIEPYMEAFLKGTKTRARGAHSSHCSRSTETIPNSALLAADARLDLEQRNKRMLLGSCGLDLQRKVSARSGRK